MNYNELKVKHQKELDSFPMFFAFSQKQLEEGLEKLNVKKEELCSVLGGGFMRKADKQAFFDMFDRHEAERKEAFQNDDLLVESIVYELGNHEYGYTYDATDTVHALGLDLEDERTARLFIVAKKRYLKEYNNCN